MKGLLVLLGEEFEEFALRQSGEKHITCIHAQSDSEGNSSNSPNSSVCPPNVKGAGA